MHDFLYPILNYHPTNKFIKSKRENEMMLHHTKILTRITMDYLSFNQALPNDHPLVRAIIQVNAISEDIYRVYNIALDQVEAVSSLMKWFNGINFGKPLEKPYFFLDETTPEVIVNAHFDDSASLVLQQVLEPDKQYYLSWSPVRVKYHCYTDMDYLRMSTMESKRIPSVKSVNIIEVDLALLYTQYRIWRQRPLSRYEDGTQKTIGQFLTTVVLPNAIEGQMQIAYFNRMCAFFMGTPIQTNHRISNKHAYIDTYKYIDDSILEVLKNYKKAGGMNFDKIISNLPSFVGMDYGNHFSYNDSTVFVRKQFIALYVVGLLPLYEVWWKLVKENQWQKWNTDEIAKLKRGIKLLVGQNIFQGNLKNIGVHLNDLYQSFANKVL